MKNFISGIVLALVIIAVAVWITALSPKEEQTDPAPVVTAQITVGPFAEPSVTTTPMPTPTPTTTPTPTPATSEEPGYQGWPVIPADQLPQPDKPGDDDQMVVIPTDYSNLTLYNGTFIPAVPDAHVATDPNSLDYIAEEIYFLTNKERVAQGLKELGYAYDLQEAADTRAKESATLFSHTRPNGEPCSSVITKDYYVTGENLIWADRPIATPKNLVSAWMNSEGHRSNILLPEFTQMAIGMYETNGVIYAVQLFIGY